MDKSTGEGNLDFGARIMDVRLGRWLSVDPLQKKYPNESNYIFVSDNPILYKDADGRDKIVTTTITYRDGSTHTITKVYEGKYIIIQVKEGSKIINNYYDIIENHTYFVNSNDNLEPGGTLYSQTFSHSAITKPSIWDKIVNFFKSDNDEGTADRGGVMYTSKDARGNSQSIKTSYSGKIEMANIDLLLQAIGAANSAGNSSVSDLPKKVTALLNTKKFNLEKVIDIMEALKFNTEQYVNYVENFKGEDEVKKPENKSGIGKTDAGSGTPYKGKKVGSLVYEGEGTDGKPIINRVNSDGTGTCCQTEPATDTGVGKKTRQK
jgi:RHS repeat-associated protein